MAMQPLDWGIVVALLLALIWGAWSTSKHTRSVSAFLAAERCGGRYLISVANEISKVGVISMVWYFEISYEVGFSSLWWRLMEEPALIVMALSGWVIYRFRQTRAMTLAQFFEMRYSRNFRVFAGLLAYVAGIINFGIFPSVGARFFIAICDLPAQFQVAGVTCSTYVTLMVLLLAVSLLLTLVGGLIAVMVTDFIQGTLCNAVFAILIVFLLVTFGWERISEAMLMAPAEQSPVHPFHIADESHFDFWYFAISVMILFYGMLSWQGTAGYNCCAKNAHEAKMAVIISGWRARVLMLIVIVLPICVRTMMVHPDFAEKAAVVQSSLDSIPIDDPLRLEAMQNQLRAPTAMRVMFPTGLLGLACAAMLGLFISTHDTYLHAWGSILIQDVVLPFRKHPFTPRQHLWLLRASIMGVAAFIFCFSLLFEHAQYVSMFLTITGAIFMGGAGAVIIGGLYWNRGTTLGAWTALLTGGGVATMGVLVKQISTDTLQTWAGTPGLHGLASAAAYLQQNITGQEMTFFSMTASILAYVLVSLLGPAARCDMDRLLHRAQYARAGETATSFRDARTWWERLGFTRDFTGTDKIITYVTVSWPLVWTGVFVCVTAYNLSVDVSCEAWAMFWHIWTWAILAAGIAVTIWFTAGGVRDLRDLYRNLREQTADATDDGRADTPAG